MPATKPLRHSEHHVQERPYDSFLHSTNRPPRLDGPTNSAWPAKNHLQASTIFSRSLSPPSSSGSNMSAVSVALLQSPNRIIPLENDAIPFSFPCPIDHHIPQIQPKLDSPAYDTEDCEWFLKPLPPVPPPITYEACANHLSQSSSLVRCTEFDQLSEFLRLLIILNYRPISRCFRNSRISFRNRPSPLG